MPRIGYPRQTRVRQPSRNVTAERAEYNAPADIVEVALARAIDAEVRDRRAGWEARVARLADELRARRLARDGVATLDRKVRRRS